jgi:oligopeptide transport system ATP-binding protein
VTDIVLEVVDLVKHYPRGRSLIGHGAAVHALDGVSFSLRRGETLGIVGESGCGKSTLAQCIMRLVEPTAGTVRVAGRDLTGASRKALRESRRLMQIVFQNPYASLSPRRTIFRTLSDPLRLHGICSRGERRGAVLDLLRHVGLGAEFLDRYPHELSGGQQQRVAIARALAVEPQVIICDEPVSALDVSVQAQVINLLLRLQAELHLSYLFISHNLALARRVSHRLAVMYLGQIVELVDRDAIASGLMHPYSQALFAAVPVADPTLARRRAQAPPGEPPSPVDLPAGCRYQSRCPFCRDTCVSTAPPLRAIGGRLVRCHFAGELVPASAAVTNGAGPVPARQFDAQPLFGSG